MQTASEKCKMLRDRLGLSQGDLAQQLGVSRNYVSMIETGDREPSKTVAALLDTIVQKNSSRLSESTVEYKTKRIFNNEESGGEEIPSGEFQEVVDRLLYLWENDRAGFLLAAAMIASVEKRKKRE